MSKIARLMQQAAAGAPKGPSEIGEAFGGGYYAGNIVQGGTEYYLIVAPKATGQSTALSLAYKTGLSASPTATRTLNDGPTATAAMVAAGSHPAAAFCAGLTIDGYSDWYLPSRDELELLYRNFKPGTLQNANSGRTASAYTYPEGNDVPGDTMGINRNSNPTGAAYTSTVPARTSISAFQSGGSEAFQHTSGQADYWSSTEYSSVNAWRMDFSTGAQYGDTKTGTYTIRAVRRVPV